MTDIQDIRAAEVDPEPVEWLLEQPKIPRRGISILVGFRGATKTTASCWLASQATSQGHEVFFASQEDDIPSFVRPRMEAAGADLARVRFQDEDDPPLRFPADTARLARYINERDTALVLLDPLSAFIPSFTSPTAARDALSPLVRISRQHNCAIMFVHHFRKSAGGYARQPAGSLTSVAPCSERQPTGPKLVRAHRRQLIAICEFFDPLFPAPSAISPIRVRTMSAIADSSLRYVLLKRT
jgi:hypothetical protein